LAPKPIATFAKPMAHGFPSSGFPFFFLLFPSQLRSGRYHSPSLLYRLLLAALKFFGIPATADIVASQ